MDKLFKSFFIVVSIAVSCFNVFAQSTVNPCSYAFETEILINNEMGFELPTKVSSLAQSLNKSLNLSIFFDTKFLLNSGIVREYHTKQKPIPDMVGTAYEVTTADNIKLGATYFDRGSDTLLVLAPGFRTDREWMSPFLAMFPDYDIVLFDFRGHGHNPLSIIDPSTWPLSVSQLSFGIDANVISFGRDEHKDIFAVVESFKKLKLEQTKNTYKNVYGLGLCYGAFILAKTQAVYPGLFNKIVLDGCWLSLNHFVEKVKSDLKSMCNPQAGGWRNHAFFSNKKVISCLEYLVKNFLLDLSDISLVNYLPHIKDTPILFFYGKNDYVVDRADFETIWNLTKTEKTAVITSQPHTRNHLKQKELFKLACDLFFELPQKSMISCLKDHKELTNYYAQKISSLS